MVRSQKPVFPRAEDIPREARIHHRAGPPRVLIDGEVRLYDGPCIEVRSPILVEGTRGLEPMLLGSYPAMTERESLAALDAAERAYGKGLGEWPQMSVADRIRCFEAFIPKMVAARDEVVRLLQWEIGKSLPDSKKEFDRTVEYIEDTIESLKDLDRTSSRFAIEKDWVAQIRRSPLGVVLAMGPYNYPLNETFATLIPAMMMGNTVVMKSPKLGVLLYEPLLDAFATSFPRGVVNTVHGDGPTVIGPLMKSGRIDVLAFIGSARVGSVLKHQHPNPNRLRCVLGLESKNAAVILRDADLDAAVKECVLGAFSYNGQRCTAIKIVFVHKSLADTFATKLADATSALPLGMPWDEGVAITPLPEPGKPEWLAELVREAEQGDARVINTGGGTIDRTFYAPAIVYRATTDMRISKVEQFGPVLPVATYEDEREVIDWHVKSTVGQQVALFGSDPKALSALIDPLVTQVCRVNLNSQCQRGPDKFPFNGRKDSAEGTLSVSDALRVFSIRSLVAAKTNTANEKILSGIISGRSSKFVSTDFIF